MLGLFKKLNAKGEWRKVSQLKVGMEISVPRDGLIQQHQAGSLGYADAGNLGIGDELNGSQYRDGDGDTMWDEIVSIEHVGEERVYDIEVEETHNFVGNNIFAHNTYANAALFMGGNVGIGTTSPASALQVVGDIQLGSKGVASAANLIFNTGSTTNQTVIKLLATTTLSSNLTLTLPTTTPSAGQAILSDVSGNLYWGNAGAPAGRNTQLQYNNSGAFAGAELFYTSSNVAFGINSTTPNATLVVQGTSSQPTLPIFAVASSSNSSLFIVKSSGTIGIGTTTTSDLLTLQGSSISQNLFNITSSTGASLLNVSWYGGLSQNISSTTAVNIQNGSGSSVFTVDTSQSATNSGMDITAGGSQTGNLLNFFSSGGTFLSGFSAAGGLAMNISSTTAVTIQNGSGLQIFAVNTTSGVINIATSSSTTIASILGTEGNFTIGDDGLTGATDGRIWLRSRGTTFRFNSTGNTADYSEFFYQQSTTTPELGTVMMQDTSTSSPASDAGLVAVSNSSSSYSSLLVGVVTNKGTGNNNPNDDRQFGGHYVNVGLLGHIATKVTNENGNIQPGDYLTSSAQFNGYAMKATRSGEVIGQALAEFDPTASSTLMSGITATTSPIGGLVLALVKPGYQIINNTFVLGDSDGQLATATSTGSTLSLNGRGQGEGDSFLINQKGSGNILQLQKDGIDKFLVQNDGAVAILANTSSSTCSSLASSTDCNLLTVSNGPSQVFAINAVGDIITLGHITVGKDTAGTAKIAAGQNQAVITFAIPYALAPKVIITMNGLPGFYYGITDKSNSGFTITTSQPVPSDTTFDWVALAQPLDTASNSSLNTAALPIATSGGGSITPTLNVVLAPSNSSTSISVLPASGSSSSPQGGGGEVGGTASSSLIQSGSVAGASTSTQVSTISTASSTPVVDSTVASSSTITTNNSTTSSTPQTSQTPPSPTVSTSSALPTSTPQTASPSASSTPITMQ